MKRLRLLLVCMLTLLLSTEVALCTPPNDNCVNATSVGYYFLPDTTVSPCESMCQDINGDGVTNIDDLTIFVADWLASCP